MHTVVHTKMFEAAAKRTSMTEAEISALEDILANDPEAGDVIQGSGGCRKVRVAGRGKGKSGGYRVITFYSGPAIPLFLLTVFSKGRKTNLKDSEVNELRGIAKTLVDTYRTQPVSRR
jgi:hypothetical protein